MSTDASPSRIVRWEILKGLPGEGPVPKHFHLGQRWSTAQNCAILDLHEPTMGSKADPEV